MCDEIDEPQSSLEIGLPEGSAAKPIQQPWNLIAYNRKALKGWIEVCEDIAENATRCYNWLREHPKEKITGRCFELKYKQYAGIWCFEIGSGQRVYYKPREQSRDVVIYFAGKHPSKIPYPPKDL